MATLAPVVEARLVSSAEMEPPLKDLSIVGRASEVFTVAPTL